jgi:NAD(P)H-dependent FMN reductase
MSVDHSYKIQVIIGSTRPGRLSEKPAQWIAAVAAKRPELAVELVDLRDYPLPFYNEPKSPRQLQGKYPDERVQAWSGKAAEADGYIIVTPEYNHGYPAVLKNALDSIYPEWNNKPVGFVSYGTVGGARSVEQLRLVAVELQMAPIQRSLHVLPQVMMALRDPHAVEGANPFEPMTVLAEAFLDQLTWWVKALKAAREG